MKDDATIVMCRYGIKETEMYLLLVLFTTHLPLPHLHLLPCCGVLEGGLIICGSKCNATFFKLYEVFGCLPIKPRNTTSLKSRDSQQYSCWGDWIAQGTYISFNSRPEHHSFVKDNWWVKSPGSCQRVINGDRYTTWETGWEGKKIIYKRIVNSCTYC